MKQKNESSRSLTPFDSIHIETKQAALVCYTYYWEFDQMDTVWMFIIVLIIGKTVMSLRLYTAIK